MKARGFTTLARARRLGLRASSGAVLAALVATLPVPSTSVAAQARPPLAEEEGLNGTQREEVIEMIESFLVNNPDVLARALARLNSTNAPRGSNVDAIAKRAPRAAIAAFADPSLGSMVTSTAEGRPHIVIGIDYACPFCRTLTPRLDTFMRRHPEARIGFRETPILSPESELAAKVGIAVSKQGRERYLAYHFALMSRRGPLTEQAILDAAAQAGADLAKVADAAASPETAAALDANRALMRGIGVLATPMVWAGGEMAWGAFQANELEALYEKGKAEVAR